MAVELEVKKPSFVESSREYFHDIRTEMKRVTWPNRAQVESTTVVVILSVFVFAAYFKIIDTVISVTVTRAYNALVK
jgi:preprotein translocase subunit SecE